MIMEYHPPHIYQDETIYFITARTKDRVNIFLIHKKSAAYSLIVFERSLRRFDFGMQSVGLLNTNHYHILVKVSDGSMLGRVCTKLTR